MWMTSPLPDVTPVLRLRGFLIRPALRRCGANLQVARNVYIAFPDQLEVGRDVFIGYGTWIQAGGGITLADQVLLGPYVVLIAGDHTLVDGSYRFGPPDRAAIVLGRGCWIGAHATVTKGVTVGAGALVAANAVAVKDLPPGCVAGGVPAKVIRAADAGEPQ